MGLIRIKYITLITVLIITSSLYGLFSILGIPTSFLKLFYISLPLFIVMAILYRQQINFYVPFIGSFALYSSAFLISAILNDGLSIKALSFYHYTLIGYLVLLCGVNLNLSKYFDRINSIFVFLIAVQILSTLIKLIAVGRMEIFIGTLSYTTGSLNTVYPLLALAFLISLYIFIKPNRKYILLAFLLFLIPYTGEKRAFIFFLPLFLTYLAYLYNFKILNKRIPIKLFISISIFSFVVFYLGAMSNKTLNLTGSGFDSIDLGLIYDYVKEYNYREREDGIVVGRLAGLIQSFRYTINNDFYSMLFGNGPSSLIGYTSRDGTELEFGIANSGSFTGLATYVISVGLLGTVFYLTFFLSILKELNRIIRNHSYDKSHLFFSISSIVLFLLDFTIYSRTFAHSHFFSVWVFLYIGFVIRQSKVLQGK